MPYPCEFEDCGKVFQRKEHLVRHEYSHKPESLYVCQVCNKKFNRSDSLRRHLTRHGPEFQPGPSRSKKACITCRTGKIKCDGEHPCSVCSKKDLTCKYRNEQTGNEEPVAQSEEGPRVRSPSISTNTISTEQVSADTVQSGDTSISSPLSDRPSANNKPQSPQANSTLSGPESRLLLSASSTTLSPKPPPPSFQKRGVINWLSVQIQKDNEDRLPEQEPLVEDVDDEKYMASYFESFNHRWQLVHRPSLKSEKESHFLRSAVKMMGAWLLGTETSKEYALKIHSYSVGLLMALLLKVNSQDKFQESLLVSVCDAALINIIFALYNGSKELIGQACTLRTVLIAALRQVGLFSSETAWSDEKPGFFLALRDLREGQRSKLASCLFIIDSYLNLIQSQPASIMVEELHFNLPSSFALWNADGLDVWAERLPLEPSFRKGRSILTVIQDSTSESLISAEYPLRVEDLRLSICAMQHNIWRMSASTPTSESCEMDIILQKDTYRKQLLILKEKLDKMINQHSDEATFGDEEYMPLRQYFGFESHSQLNWQEIVRSRIKDLIFDATMLYHLFSLHLHADIPAFTALAANQNLTPTQQTSEKHTQSREKRETATRKWTSTPTARQALCHAVEILTNYQSLNCICPTKVLSLDPVAYISLTTAALIIYTFCKFGKPACDVCLTQLAADGRLVDISPLVELTSFSIGGEEQREWKESWIEMGENTRVQVQGVLLCACNVTFLMPIFRVWVPEGWECMDWIAPGVLRGVGGV